MGGLLSPACPEPPPSVVGVTTRQPTRKPPEETFPAQHANAYVAPESGDAPETGCFVNERLPNITRREAMRFRLALGVSAMVGALALPAAAYANGDTAISDPLPGAFRLNSYTLEPGCFVPGRNAPADVDAHFTFDEDGLATEAHVTVSHGASFSVDQVLVPSLRDGYRVINEFDTGTVDNDSDIDPGQTATGLTSPKRFLDRGEIIVCVSDHPTGDTSSNEPYNQEDGGLVSAKNRPIIAP